MSIIEINAARRTFLKVAGLSGGGLVIGISLTGCGTDKPAIIDQKDVLTPNAFLQISAQNEVLFHCPRDEMGQGVTTGLTTIIAEELDIDPAAVVVKFASVHEDYTNTELGVQVTGGSTSVKTHYQQLRQVGAVTRQLLLSAAAAELGVEEDALSTDNGRVLVADRAYPYGKFAERARSLPLPKNVPLKSKSEFKYIGKKFARLDAAEKSTGTAVYGIDVEVPGMLRAVIKRCPVVGGKVAKLNSAKAEAIAGVTQVIDLGVSVAVIADKFWQAKTAAALLEIEWQLPKLAQISSPQLKADYAQAMQREEGEAEAERGDLKQAFASAEFVVEQDYWAPYLAHAPLEPMNAVVDVADGRADVWSGTQAPAAAQGLVARVAGLAKSQVTVHSCYMGGGFGRRSVLNHIVETTQLAVATGKPIQLVWTREDDIQNGFYRPASLMRLKAGVDSQGSITAWQAKRVGGNILPDMLEETLPSMLPRIVPGAAANWLAGIADSIYDGWAVDHASIEGLYEDYDLPNREVRHVTLNHGLPLLYWRSVGHSYTAFAKEVLIDELAQQAQLSAIDFRLKNTQNNPRLHQVIKAVSKAANQLTLSEGQYLGYAAHGSFNSYVAQAAVVSIERATIRVHQVVCAVDCGQVINPDIVRGQMEGAIMFGLTAALYGEIELVNGAVKQSNFHDYPILRMSEAPAVETIIIDSNEAPTGVGEPGLPPLAPAVANAVYAASGLRLRSLPLRLS